LHTYCRHYFLVRLFIECSIAVAMVRIPTCHLFANRIATCYRLGDAVALDNVWHSLGTNRQTTGGE
jgi:hypothetical protein